MRAYHDFIIYTDDPLKDDRGRLCSYSVRVFDSPAGQGERAETVAIADWLDLQRQKADLDTRAWDGNVDQLVGFGRRLAELMLPEHARDLFSRSRSWLKPDEGLRIRLRLIEDLVTLPWEYLYVPKVDSDSQPSGFLALDPQISIVRHEAIEVPVIDFVPSATRRIIVAMASPQPWDQYPKLPGLRSERQRIAEALNAVQGVDAVYLPAVDKDLDTVGAQLEDVHETLVSHQADIFHFSGHGDFETRLGPLPRVPQGTGVLVFADEHNQADPREADQLCVLLTTGGVRLVVLGACKSAERDVYDQWSAVATSVLKNSIPAVVAMQLAIDDDLAASFAHAFYETLVGDRLIDEAVAQARQSMFFKSPTTRDWGAPVLYLRASGGRIFEPVQDTAARQRAEEKADQRSTLSAAWWDWLASGKPADEEQVRYLEQASASLELPPPQVLLLLRSALAHDMPADAWVARFHRNGAAWLQPIDDPGAGGPPDGEAARLLGLDNPALPARPADVGPVAWSAACNPDATIRRTAALALTALAPSPEEGLDRLRRAVARMPEPGKRRARRAELRGTLADADAEIAEMNGQLPLPDQLAIWRWRSGRRFHRERSWLYGLARWGGLGAGLALGILRALMAIPGRQPVGVFFAISFFWGGILGLGLAFGMGLAGPLLLEAPARPGSAPSRRRALFGVGLATICFGVAHILVAGLNGLSLAAISQVAWPGFLVGLAVSLGLYDQPRAGWHMPLQAWAGRLLATAGILVLAQLPALRAGCAWTASVVIFPAQTIANWFGRYPLLRERLAACSAAGTGGCGGGLFGNCLASTWSMADAVLVGLCLVIGITAGMYWWESRETRRG